jgi:hypothetical protein
MERNPLAKGLLLLALALIALPCAKSQEKKSVAVFMTSDCHDTVGSIATSALRERIRGSNGYSLATGSTKGKSGFEILLTCAAIPGHESSASAVSYVFDALLPDGARFFVQPGVGVVGRDGVDGWAQTIFSQFDDWATSTQRAMTD